MMKQKFIPFISIILFLVVGCATKEEKQAFQFIQELDIELPAHVDSCYVIHIPGNGCNGCIQGAINDIKESEDTIFVFSCNSEKEFYLQSRKKSSLFSNLILDKNHAATRAKIATTYPIVFLFVDGKYDSQWPYSRNKNLAKEYTTIKLNKSELDLGTCTEGLLYKDTVRITNTGDTDLIIDKVYSSCDCTTVEWENKQVKPQQFIDLYITFKAEEPGDFERYVTIDCNVSDSPVEIPIKGYVKGKNFTSPLQSS